MLMASMEFTVGAFTAFLQAADDGVLSYTQSRDGLLYCYPSCQPTPGRLHPISVIMIWYIPSLGAQNLFRGTTWSADGTEAHLGYKSHVELSKTTSSLWYAYGEDKFYHIRGSPNGEDDGGAYASFPCHIEERTPKVRRFQVPNYHPKLKRLSIHTPIPLRIGGLVVAPAGRGDTSPTPAVAAAAPVRITPVRTTPASVPAVPAVGFDVLPTEVKAINPAPMCPTLSVLSAPAVQPVLRSVSPPASSSPSLSAPAVVSPAPLSP